MRPRVWKVALLLFGSGFCALVYQVAWLRELRLIFGASTAASAAVLAIFMGGLGLGGVLLGRRADRHRRPLAFYAQLELAIALSAAVTPALVWLARQAYIAAGGSMMLGLLFGTVVRLILSALVLAVPTVLMGGTLPAAARAVESAEDARRRRLAALYGSNALGAVVGATLSSFVLLEALGTRSMLWSACLVNIAVSLLAFRVAARLKSVPEGEPAAIEEPEEAAAVLPAEETARQRKKKRRAAAFARQAAAAPAAQVVARPLGPTIAPPRFVLAAAAIVGFSFFLMELVWYRMLGPLLGGTTYTFGLILAVALSGIGLGAALYARGSETRVPTLAAFALTCGLEALAIALPYALGDRLALITVLLRPIGAFGFLGYVGGWTLIAALVVFPAAVVAGFQFPLLIGLLGRGREQVGSHVGLAYAWNTVGGIVGSLAGGFGLLPLLTATGSWSLVVVLLAGLGLVAAFLSWKRERRGRLVLLPHAIAAASLLLILIPRGPTAAWRHSPIGAGRVDLGKATPNTLKGWVRDRRRQLDWEAEGLESSVGMLKVNEGVAFAINGKIDGSSRGDAGTQVMSGIFSAVLHPAPRRVLVVGLGTGSTAGWLGAVPSIERVDVVELEPVILDVARDCAPVNRNVLSNPKVKTFIGDAREVLLAGRGRYDLIFSEPSNPYRAGISSMYTREYYRAAARQLKPGGIFVQWMQAYEVDNTTIRTIYATLTSVFPFVETWHGRRPDLLLVGSREPIVYDAARMRARLAEEPFVSGMENAWRVSDLEGFLSHFIARDTLSRAIARQEGAAINTDDRNRIEFGFARSVGLSQLFNVDELRQTARLRQEDRPIVGNGAVDWTAVERYRISTIAGEEALPPLALAQTAETRKLTQVQIDFLEGRSQAVLARWRSEPWEPLGTVELSAVAEALADAGDETALFHIGKLRETHPGEAEATLARLRWRQGRNEEAFTSLEEAFLRYRRDPWPLRVVMTGALDVAVDLGSRDRAVAERAYALLKEPFALDLLHGDRLLSLLKIAAQLGEERYAEAIRPLEPDVPWRQQVLVLRLQSYEKTGDPLAAAARRDLEEFLEGEPKPFTEGLPLAPQQAAGVSP